MLRFRAQAIESRCSKGVGQWSAKQFITTLGGYALYKQLSVLYQLHTLQDRSREKGEDNANLRKFQTIVQSQWSS